MNRSSAFALLALAHCCTGLLVQQRVAPFTAASHRSCLRAEQPLLVEGDSDGKAKITIKPPSSGGDAAAAEQSISAMGATTSIKVNVRPKTDPAPEVAVVDDDDTKVTIKVNKIKKDLAPAAAKPEAPPRPKRSEAEELLLNATQAANCTRLIKALQMGANPNIRDPNGRTPLHFCAGIGARRWLEKTPPPLTHCGGARPRPTGWRLADRSRADSPRTGSLHANRPCQQPSHRQPPRQPFLPTARASSPCRELRA